MNEHLKITYWYKTTLVFATVIVFAGILFLRSRTERFIKMKEQERSVVNSVLAEKELSNAERITVRTRLATNPEYQSIVTLVAIPRNVTIPAPEAHVVSQHVRAFRPALHTIAPSDSHPRLAALRIPLDGDQEVEVSELSHQVLGVSSGVFTGRAIDEHGGGHIVLSYVNDAVSGIIHLPSRKAFYEIRTAPDGVSHILSRLDPSVIPPCGCCKQLQSP